MGWTKWGWHAKRAREFSHGKLYVYLFISIPLNVEIKAQDKAGVAVCRGTVIGNWKHNLDQVMSLG